MPLCCRQSQFQQDFFSIAFYYGVFGTIFFEHLFYVWVASTVALAASLFRSSGRRFTSLHIVAGQICAHIADVLPDLAFLQ